MGEKKTLKSRTYVRWLVHLHLSSPIVITLENVLAMLIFRYNREKKDWTLGRSHWFAGKDYEREKRFTDGDGRCWNQRLHLPSARETRRSRAESKFDSARNGPNTSFVALQMHQISPKSFYEVAQRKDHFCSEMKRDVGE